MSVVVITPPEPIVSLELAKQHLRVQDDDDDTLILAYLAAAQGAIDGPAGWLGRCVGLQTLEYRTEGFYGLGWRWGRLELPFPPVVSIESVTYTDSLGADVVLGSAAYAYGAEGLAAAYGTSWPSGRLGSDALRIRYVAGYAVAPAPILAAVLLEAAALYENRQSVVIDPTKPAVVENPTAERLLSPYRIWRV